MKRKRKRRHGFFNILNYIFRTWPWILVALAGLVIFPELEDPELAYPLMMLEFLPSIVLGLVVASLIAAFMSTVSTSINWGASYLTNDLYRRFFAPDASQAQLVFAGRVASALVTVIGAIAAFFCPRHCHGIPISNCHRYRAWISINFKMVLVAH